ncbi:DUF423 domain-containing protein [Methylopila sp. M107]|uniref:DUF423 domain-containing protein n=1 Tax=Methylopila sp. M107 TaxID=1101190 RepID=UPI00035E395F|nr:DUF423 domain-containing protein [Methylopila sp. M107]
MSRSPLPLVAVAGLYGAVGVATAAAAAHMPGDARLGTASQFLMLHAGALLGAAAAARAFGLGRLIAIPAWGIALGVFLFSGDLLVRVWLGASPVPVAAPVGGTILIASWLALSIGAAVGGLRGARSK